MDREEESCLTDITANRLQWVGPSQKPSGFYPTGGGGGGGRLVVVPKGHLPWITKIGRHHPGDEGP